MMKLHPVLLTLTQTLAEAEALLSAESNEEIVEELQKIRELAYIVESDSVEESESARVQRDQGLALQLSSLRLQYHDLTNKVNSLRKSSEVAIGGVDLTKHATEISKLNNFFLTEQRVEMDSIWAEIAVLSDLK